MTDGNTYAINKHLNDQEDWDALQEVTAELEQAEARIEELEANLKYWMKDSAAAWDKCEENRLKLAKAIDFVAEVGNGFKFGESLVDWANLHVLKARTLLAELKGETGCSGSVNT